MLVKKFPTYRPYFFGLCFRKQQYYFFRPKQIICLINPVKKYVASTDITALHLMTRAMTNN
jgi:hypothetical protein